MVQGCTLSSLMVVLIRLPRPPSRRLTSPTLAVNRYLGRNKVYAPGAHVSVK